jgi:hypothetical protein
MFNRTFWKFVFSFVTVIVVTFLFIMVVGLSAHR